jgi:tripartite-type tricarboxylate transporter receptor subunit TctC
MGLRAVLQGLGLAALLAGVPALAQTSGSAPAYPAKPIRLIVSTAPGGLMDVPARLMADYFDRRFGQRIVVDNRGGAAGVLGDEIIAHAPADGYTLGQVQLGELAINPFVLKKLSFDPLADLVPVGTLTRSALVVSVASSLGVDSLAAFIERARREPGRINYGPAGQGSIPHLGGEVFSAAAGVQLTPVHYRGAGPALSDLLAGQVQVIFVGYGVVRSSRDAGLVRILAASQNTRLAGAPEVPNAAEAGLPAFDMNTWFGIVAPRGTPQPAIDLINREIATMLADPVVSRRLIEAGLEPYPLSPAAFGARIRKDYDQYRALIARLGLSGAQ